MEEKQNHKKKLVDITLEEAVMVIHLGEGFCESESYQLRIKTNPFDEKFAQLFYVRNNIEHVAANFSDTKDAVMLADGDSCYRTFYRIIRYLEGRGFDLVSADRQPRHSETSFG